MMHKRKAFAVLRERLREPRRFIQSLIGPRQVGKTTLARQVADEIGKPTHYISADIVALQDIEWLQQQWGVARQLAKTHGSALLIADEVQKIPNWSSIVKFLWDEDSYSGLNLYVLILGSSPWLMQKGLVESLAGRFEAIPITHWSFPEMREVFGWSLEHYIYFGGYPGAAPFSNEEDVSRWMTYINDSIVETTLSRDILLMNQINKPILLRRAFQFGCVQSGQVYAYRNMLIDLEESTSNTTTVAHYVELLAGAGLLTGLQKFANKKIHRKVHPKFAVFNTALMSAQSEKSFKEAIADREWWGRLVESTVGAYLLNSIRGTQIELFYWRDGNQEVDFILKHGNKLTAIEVKSGIQHKRHAGIVAFTKNFKHARPLLVGAQGIPLESFISEPIQSWL